MTTFEDKIKAEIASHETAIVALKAHLAAGEGWLQKEADAVWAWFGKLFSHPAVTPAVAAVIAATPAPATPPVAAAPTPAA